MTQRDALLAEIDRLRSELAHLEYAVSHDLRAPLRAVVGFATMLRRDYTGALGAEGQELIQRIQDGGTRMQSMMEGILDLSRLGRHTLRLERVRPAALFEQAHHALSRQDPVSVPPTFTQTCDVDLLADRSLFERLAAALMDNAHKATRPRQDPGTIHLTGTDSSTHALLRLEDNGIGFNEERGERIFEVFHRAHSRGQFPGHGCGLAVVQRIVERHGGSIRANSPGEQGAVIEIHWPRTPATESQGAADAT